MEGLGGFRTSAEHLSHRFRRTQKMITRETAALVEALEGYKSGRVPLEALSLEQISQMREAVRRMKTEVQDTDEDERNAIRKASLKLEHAARCPSIPELGEPNTHVAWKQVATDSLLADFLLRHGHVQSAEELAVEANIQDFVDVNIFRSAQRVAQAIRNQDIGPAQAWCNDHASKLRRIESPLEFHIRKEEFLALVLASQQSQALDFAREHLAPVSAAHSEQLMRLMGALAFTNLKEAPEEFSSLLSEARWESMHDLFWTEMKRVYGIPATAPLVSLVQMGLLSLKTNTCMDPTTDVVGLGCPVCCDEGRAIANQLPNPYIGHTTLVCRVSGRVLDQNDPPVSLPNGQVLASSYVEKNTKRGVITCPFTHENFSESDVRPVYII